MRPRAVAAASRSRSDSVKACPACGSALETPVACSSCGALLDIEPGLSPWALLGMEPSWNVLPAELQKRLVRCSRLVHPDFFGSATEAARELAGRHSAQINEAYALLLDPARRAEWVIMSAGGPSAQSERAMPQAFLMQVLEWNETLESVRSSTGADRGLLLDGLQAELAPQRDALLGRLAGLMTPLPAAGAPQLLAARKELNALAYLDRALAQVKSLRLGN